MAALVLAPSSPIPSISISFAPAEELPTEPFSPFDSIAFPVSSPQELNSPRSTHLLPPMTGTPRISSPLGSGRKATPAGGKGLDRARFESLLRSTRERALSQQQQAPQRPVAPASNAALDLRKQVALKAHHKSKAAERRALFLSKIEAPPSPSATDVPVTPPESPAVLHYSLPSPGLESPISLFETLQLIEPKQKRAGWIEHIEFNAPKLVVPLSPRKPMPSLDQISARITSQYKQQQQQQQQQTQPTGPKRVRLPIGAAAAPVPVRAPIPLPAFLRTSQRTPSPPAPKEQVVIPVSPAAPARLPLPSLASPIARGPTPPPAPHPRFNERVTVLPAPSPRTARSRRTSEVGPTAVTQANLTMLESRNEMSRAMLEKIMRRVSAPAELERVGRRKGEVFGEHRVFAIPGGF